MIGIQLSTGEARGGAATFEAWWAVPEGPRAARKLVVVIAQSAIARVGAIGIENDGDIVEVLRNIGSPEAMIPHFSLTLRNPSLQSRLLVLADLTDFGKQRVSHRGEAQEHTLFLVSFATD